MTLTPSDRSGFSKEHVKSCLFSVSWKRQWGTASNYNNLALTLASSNKQSLVSNLVLVFSSQSVAPTQFLVLGGDSYELSVVFFEEPTQSISLDCSESGAAYMYTPHNVLAALMIESRSF